MSRRHLTLFSLLAVAVLVAAACSSTGATASPSVAPSVAPSAAAPSASPSASESAEPSPSASDEGEGGETYKLVVATGSVGSYLTGEDGKTLYTFTNDTKDSGKSTCNGDCATAWPPYLVDELDEVKPDSAITGKLALITRDDGKKQLSYKGWPLYYFANDKVAGDTKGQGLFGKWFVVNP